MLLRLSYYVYQLVLKGLIKLIKRELIKFNSGEQRNSYGIRGTKSCLLSTLKKNRAENISKLIATFLIIDDVTFACFSFFIVKICWFSLSYTTVYWISLVFHAGVKDLVGGIFYHLLLMDQTINEESNQKLFVAALMFRVRLSKCCQDLTLTITFHRQNKTKKERKRRSRMTVHGNEDSVDGSTHFAYLTEK